MLVAVSIMVVMMTIVEQIYNTTGQAVATGIGLSHIIANNRGVDAQITRDGECMLGPSGNGFLVIRYGTDQGYLPVPHSSVYKKETIASDQLVFVRSNGSSTYAADGSGRRTAQPLVPYKNNTYANFPTTASDIIVWYGHGLRTDKYGTTTSKLGTGINRTASQWILARQAMYLVGRSYKGVASSGPGFFKNDSTHPYAAASEVSWPNGPQDVPNYTGLGDVCWRYTYYNPTSNFNLAVVGENATAILNEAGTGINGADYQTAAIDNFTYAPGLGMWVCPSPSYTAPPGGNGLTYGYSAWQIAQMHGALAMNVSDFQVAFAADINHSGEIHTGGTTTERPDILNSGDVTYGGKVIARNGSIKWYVAPGYQNNPTNPGIQLNNKYDPSQPLTYEAPIGSYHAYYANGATKAFVWRNDADSPNANDTFIPSPWPYLIRISYRMHDSRGQVSSGYQVQGMWFEHIIKVPR